MKKIIRNACILTLNDKMDVIRGGSILIDNDTIRQVAQGDIQDEQAVVTDAEGMIVMPGFINTHTHVPMTLLRGYADDLPLHSWLHDYIFPAEARLMTPENIAIATRLAFIEMIKSGTTCFNDMYFFEEVIAGEAERVGIRAVTGESIIDFPTPSFSDTDRAFQISEELIGKWKGHATVHPSVAVHSPYSCSKETLQRAKRLADRHQTLLHIHLSETQKEVEDLIVQTGTRPAAYLQSIGLLDKNVIAAHCVHLNGEETEILRHKGTGIAHCPKSNLKLGSGIADIYSYSQAGITVSIGTDGTASNNTLDMPEEMRFAALLPKGTHLDPEVVNAKETLRMATINGAKALGLGGITGSLEPGKRADLILVHANSSNMTPFYDEYSAVVYSMNSKNIIHSMVNGEWIMKDRSVLRVKKEETVEAVNKIIRTSRR